MKQRSGFQSVVSYYDKESPAATEFRRIYTNLTSAGESRKLQILQVTSSVVGEGKSLTCAYLAITAATLNREKVALVDFDLRRPRVQDYFAISPGPGVADVLSGKSNIKNVSRSTGLHNLSVIQAGKVDSSPSDILDRADLPGFLQELKFYFDFTIIDSPPLIPVSDPMLIADKVDGVVLMVKSGSTQREVVKRAANLLTNSGANLLGVVVNDLESVLPYYYNNHYYGYHYDYSKKK